MKKTISVFMIIILALTFSACLRRQRLTKPAGMSYEQFLADYFNYEKPAPDIYPVNDEIEEIETAHGTVRIVPLLSTYLESTDMACYILYRPDGTPVGIQCEKRGYDAAAVTEETVNIDKEQNAADAAAGIAVSSRALYRWLLDCMDRYPDFRPEAVSVEVHMLMMPHLIGREEAEAPLRYYDSEIGALREFQLVEPFMTLAEGRAAFRTYLDEMSALWERVTVFPWKTKKFNKISASFLISCAPEREYYSDADSIYTLPLLTKTGKEGVARLLLFFRKGKLIAETVLEIDSGESNDVRIMWERTGEKGDEHYLPLDEIAYLAFTEQTDLTDARGICVTSDGYRAVK